MTVRKDDELAIAAAAGDELAYGESIARYTPAIYDFATRTSGTRVHLDQPASAACHRSCLLKAAA